MTELDPATEQRLDAIEDRLNDLAREAEQRHLDESDASLALATFDHDIWHVLSDALNVLDRAAQDNLVQPWAGYTETPLADIHGYEDAVGRAKAFVDATLSAGGRPSDERMASALEVIAARLPITLTLEGNLSVTAPGGTGISVIQGTPE